MLPRSGSPPAAFSPASGAPASRPMVSSVLCRCVASPPPDAAATASSPASSPASIGDSCGGAVCGGPDHRLRLWSLFQTLDVNRDGGLCVNDLAVGLRRLGLHRTEGELRVSRRAPSARAGRIREGYPRRGDGSGRQDFSGSLGSLSSLGGRCWSRAGPLGLGDSAPRLTDGRGIHTVLSVGLL